MVIEIVPLDGGCELTLTHELSPDWVDRKGGIEEGWGELLDGLAKTID